MKPEDTICNICGCSLIGPGGRRLTFTGSVLDGRYKVIKRLDRGGMGAIYLVNDQRLNKLFVVKELILESQDPEQREKFKRWFEREARLLCQLRHPNIPIVIDLFSENDKLYLVMDYIHGKNFSEELLPLSPDTVYEFALIALDILLFLHKNNIIHRDIKTEHFIKEKNTGKIFLVDFGAARRYIPEVKQTAIGTQGFASPEHYEGMADERSDIYSLGGTLHHLITGMDPRQKPPFAFDPVEEIVPDVPKVLARAINRAVQYNRDERFQKAKDMKDFLIRGRDKMTPGKTTTISSTGSNKTTLLPEEPTYDDYNRFARKRKVKTLPLIKRKPEDLGKVIHRFKPPENHWISELAFIYPGTQLACGLYNGEVIIWNLETGKQTGILRRTVTLSSSICNSIHPSPDGCLMVQAMDNRQVIVWDIITGRRVTTLLNHRGDVTTARFLNENTIATGAGDETVVVWNLLENREINRFWDHDSAVSSIAVTRDNKVLLVGTRKGTIKLWELQRSSSAQISPVCESAHRGGITGIAAATDGKILSTGKDGKLRIWEIENSFQLKLGSRDCISGHHGPINCLAVSPIDDVFVTGGQDGEVKLWRTTDGRSFHTLTNLRGEISSVDISNTGAHFTAATEEGEVVVWSL